MGVAILPPGKQIKRHCVIHSVAAFRFKGPCTQMCIRIGRYTALPRTELRSRVTINFREGLWRFWQASPIGNLMKKSKTKKVSTNVFFENIFSTFQISNSRFLKIFEKVEIFQRKSLLFFFEDFRFFENFENFHFFENFRTFFLIDRKNIF